MRTLKMTFVAVFALLSYTIQASNYKGYYRPDTLSTKNFHYLKEKYSEKANTNAALLYATVWLQKAKREHNGEQTLEALKALLHASPQEHKLAYADTLIRVAVATRDQTRIGAAYITKGALYYSKKELTAALDHYLLADKYLATTGDPYQVHKLKYAIGQTKYYLGYYEEAISLFKECLLFFKDTHDRAYLNTLHHMGLCMNKVGKYKDCSTYNDTGFFTGLNLENDTMHPYFLHSEGINQYDLGNYEASQQLLQRALPILIEKEDFANQIVAWFYIAQNYTALGKPEKAMELHKKVDTAMDTHKYIRSDLRKNYEILINHFKALGNTKEELRYAKKLLAKDSLLFSNYRYLSTNLKKQYDTKQLLVKQRSLESKLRGNDFQTTLFSLSFVTIAVCLGYKYYRKAKSNDEKCKQHINHSIPLQTKLPLKEPGKRITVKPEEALDIVQRLEKFEKEKQYLQKNMSLPKLSKILNANPRYVSQMIPQQRGMKTKEYLNKLKINHIIELFKSDYLTRKYTMDALGEEAGFGTTQSFITAFKMVTQRTPKSFIHQLNKTGSRPKTKPKNQRPPTQVAEN